MMDAGLWPPPKGWDDDLVSEDYVAPPLAVSLQALQKSLNRPGDNSV